MKSQVAALEYLTSGADGRRSGPSTSTSLQVPVPSAAASSSGGGIALDSYNAVKAYVTNGKLYGSMAHNGTASPMPKNMAKLDNCTINKIAVWINRGALNN